MLLEENFKKLILIGLLMLSAFNIWSANNKAYAFYPFGAYSHETGTFLGAYALYSNQPENLPENYQPASLELTVIMSFKKQFSAVLQNRIYLAEGRYSIGIPIRYYFWPTTFYGIGNQSNSQFKEDFISQNYQISPYFNYHLNKIVTLSASTIIEHYKISDSDKENDLLNAEVAGYEKFLISGFGIGIERKTTDSNYFPTNGSQLSYQMKIYNNFFGSDYNLRVSQFDYRIYRSISPAQTIAGQFILKSASGDIPFVKYPDLGNIMRGYVEHKYINDQFLILRLEDRIFPFEKGIAKRLGFAAFMETGQTMPSLTDINLSNQKFSTGFGLRLILLPEQMFTLRADFAFSKDGFEMEIISFEAF